MAANFPTSLDTDSTVGGNTADNPASTDATTTPSHSELHQDVGDAVQAVESKVGTGDSTAGSDQVLAGTGSGTSAWTALTVSGDATGTLASGDIPLTIAAASLENAMANFVFTGWTPVITQSGTVTHTVTFAQEFILGELGVAIFELAVTGSGTTANDISISGFSTAASKDSIYGSGIIVDSGTTRYQGSWFGSSASAIKFQIDQESGNAGSNPAFGLASGDSVAGHIVFKVA